MNIQKIFLATTLLMTALLMSCGDKKSSQAITEKKESPEECYQKIYEETRNDAIKELQKSGDKGPYAEQDLVPQGIRQIMQENCGIKN